MLYPALFGGTIWSAWLRVALPALLEGKKKYQDHFCDKPTIFVREMTLRNGKLPLIQLDDGETYEGEWLNGKMHGHGIYTFASGNR
jgi:hypothetical protein